MFTFRAFKYTIEVAIFVWQTICLRNFRRDFFAIPGPMNFEVDTPKDRGQVAIGPFIVHPQLLRIPMFRAVWICNLHPLKLT